jgi:hypothetical protein
MAQLTRWFNISGGISKVNVESADTAYGEAVRLAITTESLRSGSEVPVFKQEETALVSDRGLESFHIIESAEGHKSETRGERRPEGLVVSINSEGVRGNIIYSPDSFDVSTYELLTLDRKDLKQLAQEPFRLFDPEDLDIHVARLQSQGRVVNVEGRGPVKIQQVLLKVEGAEYQMNLTEEGELLSIGGSDINAIMVTEAQMLERRKALVA